jgi:hypothetical protein
VIGAEAASSRRSAIRLRYAGRSDLTTARAVAG